VPQDDIHLEDLTVYQNLYYNAYLSLLNKIEEELDVIINTALKNLGLGHIKNFNQLYSISINYSSAGLRLGKDYNITNIYMIRP
jgi:ABC-type multidrug transport system ATPase subunit